MLLSYTASHRRHFLVSQIVLLAHLKAKIPWLEMAAVQSICFLRLEASNSTDQGSLWLYHLQQYLNLVS